MGDGLPGLGRLPPLSRSIHHPQSTNVISIGSPITCIYYFGSQSWGNGPSKMIVLLYI